MLTSWKAAAEAQMSVEASGWACRPWEHHSSRSPIIVIKYVLQHVFCNVARGVPVRSASLLTSDHCPNSISRHILYSSAHLPIMVQSVGLLHFRYSDSHDLSRHVGKKYRCFSSYRSFLPHFLPLPSTLAMFTFTPARKRQSVGSDRRRARVEIFHSSRPEHK